MEKPEGKRPVGIIRGGWGDNIKMYVEEIGRGAVYWISLGQYREALWAVVDTVHPDTLSSVTFTLRCFLKGQV